MISNSLQGDVFASTAVKSIIRVDIGLNFIEILGILRQFSSSHTVNGVVIVFAMVLLAAACF